MRSNLMHSFGLIGVAIVAAACSGGAASPSTTRIQTAAPTRSPSEAPAASATSIATASPAAATADGRIVFDDASGQHRQIYIARADGSDIHRLVTSEDDDLKPRLSPDGRTVAFTRYTPTVSNIFVVDIDGTGLREIDAASCVKPCGGDEDVSWSPDGTQLAVTRALFADDPLTPTSTPYNVALWVMHADGSGAHQITLKGHVCDGPCPGGAQDDRAAWSPDGKRLAFTRDTYSTPEQFGIFTIAPDGSDLRQVTPGTMNADDPAWSPDGTVIAFQSPQEPTGKVEQDIYTIRPDGTGLTKLTGSLGDSSNGASWSPDGKQLVFAHLPSTDGASDMFVMDRGGSDAHLLAATHLWENSPNWGRSPGD
jgi:Tol biopolymer transport system component